MTTDSTPSRRYDVVVIGGGAAGLAGALTLARARRSVLVIDAGQPRNAPATGVHGFLSRDGMPPRELLAAGRGEVTRHQGHILDGTAVAAEPLPGGGFRVTLDDGTAVLADRLLVTTGLVDELPDLPGLAERWGREVLHCPYCHGWEVRDHPIGVLGTGPLAVHAALLWRQWSEHVTLLRHTGPSPDDEQREQLAARGIAVIDQRVTALRVTDDRLTGVTLSDGGEVPVRALVVTPWLAARSGLLASLGLKPEEQAGPGGHPVGSRVAADATGATAVPGVWVAGNVAELGEKAMGAAAAGERAAAAINHDLIAEETRRAVDTHRAAVAEHWDDRYASSERIWSGRPNPSLVRETAGLPPGRALELGCGEGADAIWLAEQGWRVTAADISQVALDRAARHAGRAGVAERIDWQRHDLAVSFPDGAFDLVSAHFFHSWIEVPRERVLRSAASAVAPGGVLLIVGHAAPPSWHTDTGHPMPHFPTPEEVLASLDLPPGQWEVLVSEEHERDITDPDGNPATRLDNTLKLRRRPG